jgi:hypothetical protein
MTIRPTKLHSMFGAELLGVDLRAVDGGTFKEIVDAFNEYSEQQVAFSRRFGPLEKTTTSVARNTKVAEEIADLSNVDPDGTMIPAGARLSAPVAAGGRRDVGQPLGAPPRPPVGTRSGTGG